MAFIRPNQVLVGTRWVKFKDMPKLELTGFIQMQAHDAMMRGSPFGSIISDAVEMAIAWQELQPVNG